MNRKRMQIRLYTRALGFSSAHYTFVEYLSHFKNIKSGYFRWMKVWNKRKFLQSVWKRKLVQSVSSRYTEGDSK